MKKRANESVEEKSRAEMNREQYRKNTQNRECEERRE